MEKPISIWSMRSCIFSKRHRRAMQGKLWGIWSTASLFPGIPGKRYCRISKYRFPRYFIKKDKWFLRRRCRQTCFVGFINKHLFIIQISFENRIDDSSESSMDFPVMYVAQRSTIYVWARRGITCKAVKILSYISARPSTYLHKFMKWDEFFLS